MIPISVCIITKNESDNLEKCLSALQPYPFEIVVVDTGSTDNSKEVALKYTDKVYGFEWINDFSAARNFAVTHASHNMILSLDTDEFVTEVNMEELMRLIEENPKGIGSVKMLNYFEANGELQYQICMLDRLFNRKYYHFENPVHEVLLPDKNIRYVSYELPVTVKHVGYLGSKEKLQEKSLRNLELLLKEVDTSPDDPYLYFQIAQCYLLMRDHENALVYFRQAMQHDPSPLEEYTRILIDNYGSTLIDFGKADEALTLLSYYNYYDNNADYLCMIGSAYLHLNQQLKALPEFIKALTAPHRDSLDPRLPSYYIGFIYELFGKKNIAKTHYQNCGDYAPALEALKRL